MKLYFKNSVGKELLIANVEDEEEAMFEIKKFCEERDYRIPYYRCWGSINDDGIWYDVGSHIEFFILKR